MKRAVLALGLLATLGLVTQIAVLGATSVWSTYQHDVGRSGRDPDLISGQFAADRFHQMPPLSQIHV